MTSAYLQLHDRSTHDLNEIDDPNPFIEINLNSGKFESNEVDLSSVTIAENEALDENSSRLERLIAILQLAFPVVSTFFLGLGANFINLAFAGHYSIQGGQSIVFAGEYAKHLM